MRGGVQAEGEESEVYGKAAQLKFKKGDVLRWVTATGGGWGDPRKRRDDKLAADFKNGFVTEDQIKRQYRPD